uniref:Uncharacterized protein n=1 Tax=Meloidogyne enterolobii TaxID=390850 RepID=A0A6V7UGW1_MELEN|nr:unnamed protein product [Meloidogyne enterolobii]
MPPQLRSRRNNKKLPTKIIPSKKLKTNKKASKIGSQKESKIKSRQQRQYSICRYPDIYMKEGETERFFKNIFENFLSSYFF